METYFPAERSAAYVYGEKPADIIRLMAARYMGDNPYMPYIWRSYDERGISCDRKARYLFNFADRFPQGEEGERCYALGDLWCPQAKGSNFVATCDGPVRIWLNDELVFASNGGQERTHERCRFPVSLREGMNRFLIACERTTIGFGCTLANAMPQWEPCNYILPFDERDGEAGFLFTSPTTEAIEATAALWAAREQDTGVRWLPEAQTAEEQYAQAGQDGYFYAWSAFRTEENGACQVNVVDVGKLWVDGVAVALDSGLLSLTAGRHDVLYSARISDIDKASVALRSEAGGMLSLQAPVRVKGRCSARLLLGPIARDTLEPDALRKLGAVHEGADGPCVWRSGLAGIALRPYAESKLYGRWTYPLGVTLFGMLEAGEAMRQSSLVEYVRGHVSQVVGIQPYALYDTGRYGFAGVNQQLCWLDALDDCGSFAALMLSCDMAFGVGGARAVADSIANYMMREQVRLPDGAFMRRDDTMWADDMYMSVPFLCRYAKLTGDASYLDEAARQLLLYRDHLFLPEKKILSHMKCLRSDKANGIPWSRGNGWVIFSLSELLQTLPEAHPQRAALAAFYGELAQGYMALQDEQGLWHQILDEMDTYVEASATAMFICAFSRGIRGGFMPSAMASQAALAVERGWKGLVRHTVDRDGNLYGVCRGSGFSFSRAYYRTLSWNFNDTHGIGIVMLAGVESLRLQAWRQGGA